MKNLLACISGAVLAIIALNYMLGWPVALMVSFFSLVYGLYLIRPTAPKVTTTVWVIVTLTIAGGFGWSAFVQYFPTINLALPAARAYRETQIAKMMAPPMAKALATLELELYKKEKAFAESIPALIADKKYDELAKTAQELMDLRKALEKSMTPPKPPPIQKLGKTLTLLPGVNTIPVGVHILSVKKTTTDWIKIPGLSYWDLSLLNKGDYKIITHEGQVITFNKDGNKYADFPNGISIFKIQTEDELDFILKVAPSM